MAKKLSQLMPDLKQAIKAGREEAAEVITNQLKRRSPYWSGQTERSYRVTADQPVANTVPPTDLSEVPERRPRPAEPSPIIGGIPDVELRREMWIGSTAEKIDHAADLAPWDSGGAYRYERAGADQGTTPNWWVIYTKGGEMQADLVQSMERKKREAGF